jgi:hypothetical protein
VLIFSILFLNYLSYEGIPDPMDDHCAPSFGIRIVPPYPVSAKTLLPYVTWIVKWDRMFMSRKSQRSAVSLLQSIEDPF